MSNEISKVKVLRKIEEQGKKIFSCEFIKKDGTIRKMVARLGVKKYLRGGTNNIKDKHSYLTVFDMKKREYRLINLETLKKIKLSGVEYKVV